MTDTNNGAATLLARPRLIIYHGPTESDAARRLLDVIARTHSATIGHGFATGRSAGGDDWDGWSFDGPDGANYLDGLAHVAHTLATVYPLPPGWRIEVDDE